MEDRTTAYAELEKEIAAVLDGEADRTARMATVAAMLQARFADAFIWTGFYVVDPDRREELVVGPYQGELGCLRIPFGKGVCGTAAATRETVIVEDVHAFPGHITCDARAVSEIVVPVFDAEKRLIAVLDIDSDQPAAFSDQDKAGLESILARIFQA